MTDSTSPLSRPESDAWFESIEQRAHLHPDSGETIRTGSPAGELDRAISVAESLHTSESDAWFDHIETPGGKQCVRSPVTIVDLSLDPTSATRCLVTRIIVTPVPIARVATLVTTLEVHHRPHCGRFELGIPLPTGGTVVGFEQCVSPEGDEWAKAVIVPKEEAEYVVSTAAQEGRKVIALHRTTGNQVVLTFGARDVHTTTIVRITVDVPLELVDGGVVASLSHGVVNAEQAVPLEVQTQDAACVNVFIGDVIQPSAGDVKDPEVVETTIGHVRNLTIPAGQGWSVTCPCPLPEPERPLQAIQHWAQRDATFFTVLADVGLADRRNTCSSLKVVFDMSSLAIDTMELQKQRTEVLLKSLACLPSIQRVEVYTCDVSCTHIATHTLPADLPALRTTCESLTHFDGALHLGSCISMLAPSIETEVKEEGASGVTVFAFVDGSMRFTQWCTKGRPCLPAGAVVWAISREDVGEVTTDVLQSMTHATGGGVLRLAGRKGGLEVEEIVSKLQRVSQVVLNVSSRTSALYDIVHRGRTDGLMELVGKMFSYGKLRDLKVEDRTIDVQVGYPGGETEVRSFAVEVEGMGLGHLLARRWADAWCNQQYLSPCTATNRKAITQVSQRYGVQTRYTSLLLLSTLEDHVRYGIAPDPSRVDLVAEYTESRGAALRRKKQEYRERRKKLMDDWKSEVNEYDRTCNDPVDVAEPERIRIRSQWESDRRSEEYSRFKWEEARKTFILRQEAHRMEERKHLHVMKKLEGVSDDWTRLSPLLSTVPVSEECSHRVMEENCSVLQEQEYDVCYRDCSGRRAGACGFAPPEAARALDAEAAILENEGGGIKVVPFRSDAPYITALDQCTTEEKLIEVYLELRVNYRRETNFYADVADYCFSKGWNKLGKRILTTILTMTPPSTKTVSLLRMVGYRLLGHLQDSIAIDIFQQALELRPFEPNSMFDVITALLLCKSPIVNEGACSVPGPSNSDPPPPLEEEQQSIINKDSEEEDDGDLSTVGVATRSIDLSDRPAVLCYALRLLWSMVGEMSHEYHTNMGFTVGFFLNHALDALGRLDITLRNSIVKELKLPKQMIHPLKFSYVSLSWWLGRADVDKRAKCMVEVHQDDTLEGLKWKELGTSTYDRVRLDNGLRFIGDVREQGCPEIIYIPVTCHPMNIVDSVHFYGSLHGTVEGPPTVITIMYQNYGGEKEKLAMNVVRLDAQHKEVIVATLEGFEVAPEWVERTQERQIKLVEGRKVRDKEIEVFKEESKKWEVEERINREKVIVMDQQEGSWREVESQQQLKKKDVDMIRRWLTVVAVACAAEVVAPGESVHSDMADVELTLVTTTKPDGTIRRRWVK